MARSTAPLGVTHTFASPLGALRVTASTQGISSLDFVEGDPAHDVSPSHPHIARLVEELASYFAGTLRRFTVPLAPRGTAFELMVWDSLQAIPWGETRSYLDVAEHVGGKNHTRAVGGANGRNPIAIVVPCHRVIAKDGSLGGYSGGLDKKRALLTLEGHTGAASDHFASPSWRTLDLPLVHGR